ncbi:hypothetical protein ACSEPQ_04595 [Pseudomonas aeruginosa]
MIYNYYDSTGVLMLDRVTPVINALFGAFNLDETDPGNGHARLTRLSESDEPQWSEVLELLVKLAGELDLAVPTGNIRSTLWALVEHFGADQDEDLARLIERHAFEDTADLDALFQIASCFDDGHHLSAILFQGCWNCSKPRLFQVGGDACFMSREVSLFGASSHTLEIGMEVRKAYLAGDVDAACIRIAQEATRLISGIADQQFGTLVQQGVAKHLLKTAAPGT